MTNKRKEELIQLAVETLKKGFTVSQVVAFIEAEYGVASEEEAKDIVALADGIRTSTRHPNSAQLRMEDD